MTLTSSTPAQDWYLWHAQYDDLASPVTRRLAVVQEQLRASIDRALARHEGEIRIISIAAGQSRDLLPVAIAHPQAGRIRARVVDLDDRNVEFAEGAGASAGLRGIEFVTADAGTVDTFEGMTPADVVLLSELLPLLDGGDAARTIATLPALVGAGGEVVVSTAPQAEGVVAAWTAALTSAGFTVVTGAVPTGTPDEPEPGSMLLTLRYDGAAVELVAGTRLFSLT